MLLDVSRAMIYSTSRAVDDLDDRSRVRMLISETKKFVTEACQKVVHHAMQVMGGIGYTNIFPIERIYRDLRLSTIWTGTNEVMSMIIANEWYQQYNRLTITGALREHERDAPGAEAAEEKIFE
jgi:alkylation response protein AidB-like acyl-CoA dehydrogenase